MEFPPATTPLNLTTLDKSLTCVSLLSVAYSIVVHNRPTALAKGNQYV